MAVARGCSDQRSSAPAAPRDSASLIPSVVTVLTTKRPSVSVPVLSKATMAILRPRSNASRFRTRIPLRAEMLVAFILTRGMARPRACGHAMTSTVTALATA